MEDEFGSVEGEDANVVRAGPRVRLVGVDFDPVVADAGGAPRVRLVRRPRVAIAHVQVGVAGERLEVDAEDEAVEDLDHRVPVLVAADVGADGDAGRQLGRLELVGEERDRRERWLDDDDRLARFEDEAVGAEARLVLGRVERRVRGGGRRAPAEHARLPRPPRARRAGLGAVLGRMRARGGRRLDRRDARVRQVLDVRHPRGGPLADVPAGARRRACARRVSCGTLSTAAPGRSRASARAAEEEEETSPPVPRGASHVSSGSGSGSSGSWKTTVGGMEGSETRVEAAVNGIFAPTVTDKPAPLTRVGSAAGLRRLGAALGSGKGRAWKMQARAPPGAS